MRHSFNDRNGHCDNCGAHRDDCLHEEFRAENWRIKASRLYDLVHELAPHVPRTMNDLYDEIQGELDEGVAWLDGKLIECDVKDEEPVRVRQQYDEIQNARNDLIDATADRLIDNREARDAMYEWGTEHGYMLLESEIDALCVAIQQCRGTR